MEKLEKVYDFVNKTAIPVKATVRLSFSNGRYTDFDCLIFRYGNTTYFLQDTLNGYSIPDKFKHGYKYSYIITRAAIRMEGFSLLKMERVIQG